MQRGLLAPGDGWAVKRRLGSARELPPWYEPYRFILGGYRVGYDTTCACARSIFELHNETVNIWTHAVGLAVWIHSSHGLLSVEPLASADRATVRAHVVLYGLCALMPLASSLAHAFHCRGPGTSQLAWKFDFASIACLLAARAALEGYLLLYCRRDLLAAWAAVGACVYGGLGGAAVAWNRPDALAPLFLALHVPLAGFFATEWPRLPSRARRLALPAIRRLVLGSLSGVAGFVVRATHVPERWIPRKTQDVSLFCDIFGASHQWWHVFTMVGPLLAQAGNARLFAFRVSGATCPG